MNNFIQFRNVNFQITHPSRNILSNIDLKVAKNDFIILLGSNGSGKSTLLKLLDRRYQASSGEIYINEKSINSYHPKTFAKLLITLTQNPLATLFPKLTVYENCVIALQQCSKKFRSVPLKRFFRDHLTEFNQHLPDNMLTLVGSLSGGEQQALALGLACLASPRVLLLDEHTSALDPNAADRLMNITHAMVKRYEIACFLTTHNLDIAKNYGTRLIALQDGKIVRDYHSLQKQQLSAEDLRKDCYA